MGFHEVRSHVARWLELSEEWLRSSFTSQLPDVRVAAEEKARAYFDCARDLAGGPVGWPEFASWRESVMRGESSDV